jgi:hypothetical protein
MSLSDMPLNAGHLKTYDPKNERNLECVIHANRFTSRRKF